MIQHTMMFGFKHRLTFGRNILNSREKDDSSNARHGRDSTCWESFPCEVMTMYQLVGGEINVEYLL